MARGKGSKKAVHKQPKPETPVRDRLKQKVAECKSSPHSSEAVQKATVPIAMVHDTIQPSIIGTVTRWFTREAQNGALPTNTTTDDPVHEDTSGQMPGNLRECDSLSTKIEFRTDPFRAPFPTIDISKSSPKDTASRTTVSEFTESSKNSHPFPPIKSLYDRVYLDQRIDPTEKRDSVFSTDWEEVKVGTSQQILLQQKSCLASTKMSSLFSWWPCRVYRWLRTFVNAVIQGFQGRRRNDFIITFGAFFVCLCIAYTTLGFLITGLIKGVNAQDVIEANCSIVYVTIPGPIITVSLIAASPTNPARGTYYYSVVNGTTQWLNSIAPPARTNILVTRTSLTPLGASSSSLLGSVGSGPIVLPTTPESPPTLLSPSGEAITVTTAITSDNAVIISIVTLLPSAVSSSSDSRGVATPIQVTFSTPSHRALQPSRPYPQFTMSTTSSSLTFQLSTLSVSSSAQMSTSSQVGSPPDSTTRATGSVYLPSNVSPASVSSPTSTETGKFPNMLSTDLVFASSLPSQQITTLSSTSISLIRASQPDSSSGSYASSGLSVSNAPTASQPDERPSDTSPSNTLIAATSSRFVSIISPPLSATILSSTTSILTGGQTTTAMSTPTSLLNVGPASSALAISTSASLAIFTSILPGGQTSTFTATTIIIFSGSSAASTTLLASLGLSSNLPSAVSSIGTASSARFMVSLPRPIPNSSQSLQITSTVQVGNTVGTTALTFPGSGSSPVSDLRSLSTFPSTSLPLSTLPPSTSLAASTLGSLPTLSTSTQFPPSTSILPESSRPLSTFVASPTSSSTLTSSSRGLLSGSSLPVLSNELLSSSSVTSSTPILSVTTLSPSSLALSSVVSTGSLGSTIGTLTTLPSFSSSITSISSTNAAGETLPRTGLSSTPTRSVSGSSSATISTTALLLSSSSMTSSIASVVPLLITSFIMSNTSSNLGSTPLMSPSLPSINVSFSTRTSSQLSSSISLVVNNLSSPVTPPALASSATVSRSSSQVPLNSTLNSLLSSSPSLSPSTSGSSSLSRPVSTVFSLTSGSSIGFPLNSSSITWSMITNSSLTSTVTRTLPPVIVTSAPGSVSNMTSALQARALMTRIVSYGETSVVFVFPTPSIVTTQTYWTGTYPTVTGPEPSDLQTIPLTTRSIRQTPLSDLPSFELFTTPSSFRTIVNNIARAAALPTVSNTPPDTEPTHCGESGNFTLSFDDTTVGPNESIFLVVQGLKNPYHHLFYANGFTYVPDKWEPYPAISQPNVALFLPLKGRLLPNTPFAGTLLPGELGAGPRASVNAYWFNAFSGYFGCALSGLAPCTLRISGYRYDAVLKQEVLVAEQNVTLPACWAYINCRLTQVFFNDQFRALSGIQFNAYTYGLGIPQVHMMDDLQMEWYNNTCSAGILRIGHW